MELKLANSCGSCINANRPKKPLEPHAAHYEVAKTERWCYLHGCHVTRETTCDDHEGVNRAAKTAFTRIKNFNERIVITKKVVELIGDKELRYGDKTYYVKDNWLWYKYDSIRNSEYRVRTKSGYDGKCMNDLLKML